MEDESPQTPDGATGDVPAASPSGAAPSIDVALLAAKVYRLMQEELRLERARAGGAIQSGRRQ